VLLDNAISLKSKEDSAFAYHAIPWLEGADRDTDDAGPSDLKSDAVSGSGGVEHILVFAPQHRPAMLYVGHHLVDPATMSFWFQSV